MYSSDLQLNNVIDQPSELNSRIVQLYSELSIASSGYSLEQFSDFVYQTNSKIYQWPLAKISDAVFQALPIRYTLHLVFDNPSLYVYLLLVGLLVALIRRKRTATLILFPALIYFLGLLITSPVADFRYVYPLIPLLIVAWMLLFQKAPRASVEPPIENDSEISPNPDTNRADTNPADNPIEPEIIAPADQSTDEEIAQLEDSDSKIDLTEDSVTDSGSTENENLTDPIQTNETPKYELPTVIPARGSIPPTIYNAWPKPQFDSAKISTQVSPNVSVPPTVIPAQRPNSANPLTQTDHQPESETKNSSTNLVQPVENYPIYPNGSTLTPSTESTKWRWQPVDQPVEPT
jgi:hypothetical protein